MRPWVGRLIIALRAAWYAWRYPVQVDAALYEASYLGWFDGRLITLTGARH